MTKKAKKYSIRILALAMGFGAAGGFFFENLGKEFGDGSASADLAVSRVDGLVKTNTEDYFDANVTYKLPAAVSSSQEISPKTLVADSAALFPQRYSFNTAASLSFAETSQFFPQPGSACNAARK